MSPADTVYIDRAGGRWESWTRSDGARVPTGTDHALETLRARLERRGYRVIVCEPWGGAK